MKRKEDPEKVIYPKCINCHERRACILVEASVPMGDSYEPFERVMICLKCLKSEDGTLGHYLASFLDRKELPRVEGDHLVYVKNPVR